MKPVGCMVSHDAVIINPVLGTSGQLWVSWQLLYTARTIIVTFLSGLISLDAAGKL